MQIKNGIEFFNELCPYAWDDRETDQKISDDKTMILDGW